jgi:hypothetical protein
MVFRDTELLCRVPVHISSGTEVAPTIDSVELHQFFSDFALKMELNATSLPDPARKPCVWGISVSLRRDRAPLKLVQLQGLTRKPYRAVSKRRRERNDSSAGNESRDWSLLSSGDAVMAEARPGEKSC